MIQTCSVREGPTQADRAGGRRAHRNGYEHLAPLFVEHARLPHGDPRRTQLREELITGYRPVAQHIAQKYRFRDVHPEDLEQVAAVGLILAIDRFKPEQCIDFLAFAVPTITGEVLRHLRDRATTIRLPRRLRELQARIYDTTAVLTQRHGRTARSTEIATALDVEVRIVLEALAAQGAGHTCSLDEPAYGDGIARDRTRLRAALGQVESEFEEIEYRESLHSLLSALPERQRAILLLRFFGGLTQSEIGQRIGISQTQVSRVLTGTLSALRGRCTVG